MFIITIIIYRRPARFPHQPKTEKGYLWNKIILEKNQDGTYFTCHKVFMGWRSVYKHCFDNANVPSNSNKELVLSISGWHGNLTMDNLTSLLVYKRSDRD